MADERISARLSMASVTALPQRDYHTSSIRRSSRASKFQVSHILQKLLLALLIGVLSFTAYIAASHYFIKSIRIVGTSMVPTLEENGSYILNLWTLRGRDPHRGEIIVLRDPLDHSLVVKRVVATGGDSVLFKDGKVFVNGKMIDEPYLLPNTKTFTYSQAKEQFITCGRDQYLVLGDNRIRSIDSRAYGPVARQDILGLVQVP